MTEGGGYYFVIVFNFSQ